MRIPQSLAYAMLAGLPPEYGLYASIAPLLAYTLLGTSRTLAVGTVAVVSLMTATAAATIAAPGSPDFIAATLALALLSGLMLIAMGLFRRGFLANLLSHPVIAAFITASAFLIATSQIKHIIGVNAGGETMLAMLADLARSLGGIYIIGSLAWLWMVGGLRPDRWDLPGGAVCLVGAAIIIGGSR